LPQETETLLAFKDQSRQYLMTEAMRTAIRDLERKEGVSLLRKGHLDPCRFVSASNSAMMPIFNHNALNFQWDKKRRVGERTSLRLDLLINNTVKASLDYDLGVFLDHAIEVLEKDDHLNDEALIQARELLVLSEFSPGISTSCVEKLALGQVAHLSCSFKVTQSLNPFRTRLDQINDPVAEGQKPG
jgi:hypothetical protein